MRNKYNNIKLLKLYISKQKTILMLTWGVGILSQLYFQSFPKGNSILDSCFKSCSHTMKMSVFPFHLTISYSDLYSLTNLM